MVQLHYDKDEFRLIARKGRGLPVSKNRERTIKNNVAYSKTKGKTNPYSNPKNSHHVLVKITGGALNQQKAREHFNYITRNDELPIYDDRGNQIPLKQAKAEVDKIIEDLSELRKDARRTYQMAFSRKGKTDPELLMQVVAETVRTQFPNNKFYYAVHEDTDNTHVHVVIERKGIERSKPLRIDKSRLNVVKKCFAEIQNKYGLQAVFLSETDKQKKRNQGKSQVMDKPKREDKRKGANEYIVLDFDKAPYEFKADGKPSFYLSVQTKNGVEKKHWSWGLQKEILTKGVKIGDKITLHKVNNLDTEQVNEKGKFKKSDWKIEVLEQSQGVSLEQFKVVEFGNAPYKFDEVGKPSFYLLLEDYKGRTKDYWGKAIEQQLKDKGIGIGDIILRDKENLKEFVKKETAIQSITQPLEKPTQQQGGFKI